ncbi:hypothetical protein VPG01_111 [Vibrio phage VPG01]|nr:hypothetical protein VPG01_111 [Vibrio phage VPG01]
MWKILIFNVIVGLLCASYFNYSQHGEIGLDWSFLDQEIHQIEN